MTSSSSSRVVLRERDLILATYGPLAIMAVDGVATVAQPAALDDMLRAIAAEHTGGIALLFVARETSALPGSEVRQRFAKTVRGNLRLKLLAGVIEGSGFAAASKRSVFTLVIGALIGPVAVKVFADPPRACLWLAAEGRRAGVALAEVGALTAFVAPLLAPGP